MNHTLVATKLLDIYNTFVVFLYASLFTLITPGFAFFHAGLSTNQSVVSVSKKFPYEFFTTHPHEDNAVNFIGLTP